MKNLFLLLLSVLIIQSITAQTFLVGGINYNITSTTNKTVEVSTYSNPYRGRITIPAFVTYNSQNYTVTAIGAEAFYYCVNVTSVIIPNGVTSFGDNAFNECNKLTSIIIPSQVTSLGLNEFNGDSLIMKISVRAIVPPATPCPWTFYGIDKTKCVLEVPVGSKAAYSTTRYWNQFQIINEVGDIGTAMNTASAGELKIYGSFGNIIVEGTLQNERISVYNLCGSLICNVVSKGEKIIIPCKKNALYLIKTGNKTAKVFL